MTLGWAQSVVTRLIACFCICGGLLSAGLSVLEYQRSLATVEVATSQQLLMSCHNLREVLRHSLAAGGYQPLRTTLDIFSQDPRIIGVRLYAADGRIISGGTWPSKLDDVSIWTLTDGDGQQGGLDLTRRTLLTAPLVEDGRSHTIQMLIDGPYIHEVMGAKVLEQLSMIWVVLGLLALLALLMLRRWLVAPLSQIVGLTRHNAPAVQFERTAADLNDEFGHLASSIAGMLRVLDQTTHQLREREHAFENLYQFAPAALISMTPEGCIVEANVRAAQLLGVGNPAALVGRQVLEMVRPEDRPRFRQSVSRLELDRQHRCELCVLAADDVRDVDVEFTATHDDTGQIVSVRLSLLDITESRRLVRQISEQRRLLDLVVNHMSDGILLVGANGKIITANQRLGQLLRLRSEDLAGQDYDIAEFWTTLELNNPGAFIARMQRSLDELSQPVTEQFEARDGAFMFQLIPVCDEVGEAVAQLWVVQEISTLVRNRRLLEQQSDQLRALQRVARRLQEIDSVDQLMTVAMAELRDVFNVEALGIALRTADAERHRQLIWDGRDASNWPAGVELAQTVRDRLMPAVLADKATSLWTDLTHHKSWSAAFVNAGMESLGAAAMFHRDQTCGIVWIGRRGGKHIERHHLYLLETLTPVLAIALDNAQLRERLRDARLTDPVTSLPSRRLLGSMISRLVNRPGHPWSMLAIDLDQFSRVNDAHGHVLANEVLRTVASKLRDTLRAGDTIVRQEADRFIVLCPELELPQAVNLAERVRRMISEMSIVVDDEPIRLTCSIGVAGSPNDHHGRRLTLDLALERLAAAQAAGRNRVCGGVEEGMVDC